MQAAPLLDIALDHLTLGRAALYAAILEGSDFRLLPSDFSHIDAAVDGLRRAGQHMTIFPAASSPAPGCGSLTGARTGPESAQSDLDEAWEIAERGPMPLFLADIHLHRARLFFREANYPWESPQKDLAEARRLIEKCGYWRRKEELEDAEFADPRKIYEVICFVIPPIHGGRTRRSAATFGFGSAPMFNNAHS